MAVALALLPAGCGGGGVVARPAGPASDGANRPLGPPDRDLFLTEQWRWPAPAPSSVGLPAADRDAIAVVAGRHLLVLLDGEGAVRWQVDRDELREVAPALTTDLVIAATEDGVAAYDRATGRPRWQAAVGQKANTPVVAGGKALVTTWEGTLFALDLADGKVAWRHGLAAPALGPAAAAGGAALATYDNGRVAGVVAVDIATGRERWSVKAHEGGVSSPAVTTGGTVVFVAGDRAAHGLSLDDGSERWRRGLQGAGSPEVVPVPQPDGSVIVTHRLGGLAHLAPTGDLLWELKTTGIAVRATPAGPGPNGWYALVLDDGRFVLGGPDRDPDPRVAPEPAMGVTLGPGGILVLATAKARQNAVRVLTGW